MRSSNLAGALLVLGATSCMMYTPSLLDDLESDNSSLTTLRFTVVADAHVQASSPATNFGAATTLVADTDPKREVFFRVSVAGVAGVVQSAKLRCWAADGTTKGPAIYSTTGGWSESTITWNNRPAPIGPKLDEKGAVSGGAWVEFDVTSVVAGNGTYDFVVVGTSDDGLYCNSREASTLRPALVVKLGTATVDGGVDSAPPPSDAGTDAAPPSGDGGASDAGATACTTPAPTRSAPGTTYYVSKTGSDAANGSSSSPFATLQKAANVVNPGDEVVVEDGSYAPPSISRGGSSTNPVWIHARNRWGAKLQTSSASGMYVAKSVGFVTIDGFDVLGMRQNADSGSAEAVFLEGHDVEFRRNHFHDIHGCTSTNNGLVGIYVNGMNNVVAGNVFDDIGRWKNEQGCSKQDSWAHDHGVYVSSSGGASNGTVIKNNLFFNIKRGFGVQLYPGSLSNVSVANNTFAFANPDHVGQIILGAAFSNTEIKNNVFYQPTGAAIQVYSFSGIMTVSNNLTTSSAITSRSASGLSLSSNFVGTDPGFVSASTNDFHLAAASAAIDKGSVAAGVNVDHDGCSRPRGAAFDIGAYER